jgi:hypothetical protein
MSKVITSNVARWAGTVTIADPLTLPQAQLIEAGLKQPEGQEENGRIWLSVIDAEKLPAIIACVEKWELENFTADPFPASPRGDSHKLIDFIFSELFKVYIGEAEVPNE